MDDEGKSLWRPSLPKSASTSMASSYPMTYPILIGTDEASDKFGGILGFPPSFLISRDGKIVAKFQGSEKHEEHCQRNRIATLIRNEHMLSEHDFQKKADAPFRRSEETIYLRR